MKSIIVVISILVSSASYAVEGYKDIYIDREQDIFIHGIVCGKDFNNPAGLKPSYVYTNEDSISQGTYYYSSPYGNYSLTFKATENSSVMARGLLKNGQTNKEQMEKNVCIVSKLEGLPASISKYLNKVTLKANDPNWDKVMAEYTFIAGKPAFSDGVFEDNRTTARLDKADKEIFDQNQKYLKEVEKIFSEKYEKIAATLPEKLEAAIQYAHKTDGLLLGKTYPPIKEPEVWTPTARERYDDLSRQRTQTIAWDKVIQQNIDWFFGLVGKQNKLTATQLISKTKPQWNERALEQVATVQAEFQNGNSLELDFLITSSKVDSEIFDSLETINRKSHLIRNNPVASAKKPGIPVKLPTSESIDVYTPAEQEVIFFSLFSNKTMGDTYRYR